MPSAAVRLPADGPSGGIVPESVGEAVGVAGGVLSVGGAAGEEDAGNGEGDEEADEVGEAPDEVGEAPDGLGDGDTVAVADDVGVAVGDGVEQCVAERVGIGAGNVPVPPPVLGVGEARVMAAVPAEDLHFCWRVPPGDGEEPFPVPFPPWEPCPPDKVPFPFVVPPPPFVPPLPPPVSTVEPTCTMASRNGGTARLRHAMDTMPASTARTGRNWFHDGRNWCHDDRNWCHDGWRDRASRAAAFSRHAQYPRHT